MATFLDVGLFQYFKVIFPVLLIFAVMFALLQKTKILGQNLTINAVVSIAVAFMAILSSTVIELINFMAPWFVLVFIFVLLLLMIYQMLGATEDSFFKALSKEKTIQWTVAGIGIIILFAGFGHVLGQKLLVEQPSVSEDLTSVVEGGAATPSFEKNIYATVFNPKVLGMIIIFLVAIFAIAFLASG